MKSSVLAFISLLVFSTAAIAQNQIIVDNNANPISDISTWSAGLAAASAGDVIMLIPSPNTYGNLNINKAVTVAGGGANGNPGQFSEVGTVIISTNGVKIGGIKMTSIEAVSRNNLSVKASRITTSAIFDNVKGLDFNYNYVRNVNLVSCDTVRMFHNYLQNTENLSGDGVLNVEDTQYLLFSNSVIETNVNSQVIVKTDNASSSLIFNNNLFYTTGVRTATSFEFGSGSVVTNGIFWSIIDQFGGSSTVNGGNLQYCLFRTNNGLGAYGGTGVSGFTLDGTQEAENNFNFFSNESLFESTGFYVLSSTSIAEDAGTGSDARSSTDQADLGIYGGLDPMPSTPPHQAIGVSIVPSVTNIRLSLPSAATNGRIILNAVGKAAQN